MKLCRVEADQLVKAWGSHYFRHSARGVRYHRKCYMACEIEAFSDDQESISRSYFYQSHRMHGAQRCGLLLQR